MPIVKLLKMEHKWHGIPIRQNLLCIEKIFDYRNIQRQKAFDCRVFGCVHRKLYSTEQKSIICDSDGEMQLLCIDVTFQCNGNLFSLAILHSVKLSISEKSGRERGESALKRKGDVFWMCSGTYNLSSRNWKTIDFHLCKIFE